MHIETSMIIEKILQDIKTFTKVTAIKRKHKVCISCFRSNKNDNKSNFVILKETNYNINQFLDFLQTCLPNFSAYSLSGYDLIMLYDQILRVNLTRK